MRPWSRDFAGSARSDFGRYLRPARLATIFSQAIAANNRRELMLKTCVSISVLALTVALGGCASKAGNVAVGAGAAGAAYEYSNKRQIDSLDKQLQEGSISKEEYDRRRKDIEGRSAVY